MVLYALVGSGRQRRFERVFDDDMAAVCGVWVKKSPSKEGVSPELLSMEKSDYGGERLPDRCNECTTVIEGDRKALAVVLTRFFAADNVFVCFLFAVSLMILCAVPAPVANANHPHGQLITGNAP
ncbi:hypothetical protein R1462_005395 [Escherichia coli]|uniref:hypothetical protein n=2 Tax=Escherichia coli TaxID=562 RepID=UPI001BFCEF5F|nr:hypothetical protein [Escherichia coli]ELP8205293.1 hypothetical protein [Escherichia coli]